MNDLGIQQLEDTALWYQKLLVPALFEQWIGPVLHEVQIDTVDRLLDVACGTGLLARAAADQFVTEAQVIGLDMNPGMLKVAEKLNPNIEWYKGVAEDLPWEDHTFDTVVCQFGLMFFENQQLALQEMYRVLKSRGRLVITVFDSLDNIRGYDKIIKVYNEVAGEEVAQTLRFPFSYGYKKELEALCSGSGIESAQVITHTEEAHFPDIRTMVLADVKGWFPLAGITLGQKKIDHIINRSETELKGFIRPDGSVRFPMSAHFITATKS